MFFFYFIIIRNKNFGTLASRVQILISSWTKFQPFRIMVSLLRKTVGRRLVEKLLAFLIHERSNISYYRNPSTLKGGQRLSLTNNYQSHLCIFPCEAWYTSFGFFIFLLFSFSFWRVDHLTKSFVNIPPEERKNCYEFGKVNRNATQTKMIFFNPLQLTIDRHVSLHQCY